MRLVVVLLLTLATRAAAEPTYAISLLGAPKLPAGFSHFPYTNPDAPKGGTVTLAANGSFDSFNGFVVRGSPAAGISQIYDTLLADNDDEASAMYAHVAESVDVAADHLSAAYTLRPEAHFNDGTPITAEDVAWTFRTLRDKGLPSFRAYYADVADVQADGDHRVVFRFKNADNRELPMILGQMAILPEHWWAGRDFSAPLTEPPLGSGPYRVDSFDLGRTVSYRRVTDWWAADLPTGRGLHNFDLLRFEYFRDPTVALEAFKAGQVDFRGEGSAKNWATAYNFPAVERGLVKKEVLPQRLPTGMQAFVMNTRRSMFKDRRVREAVNQVFDFEWMNKNLFYDSYTRTQSFFSNSDFASAGVPAGAELALLEPFRDKLPPGLFTEPFKLPVTDGSGNNRDGLRRALDLLKAAGWTLQDRKLVDAAGQQMSVELLLADPAFERIGLPYMQSLQRLGIDAHIRTIDAAQFEKRMEALDFDMAQAQFPQSESLGNEQAFYWGCAGANEPGTRNLAGICDPAVDALVGKLISAANYDELVTDAKALDRALLWGWYVVPQWHSRNVRVAYWNRFGHLDVPVRIGVDFQAWWVDPALAPTTDAARAGH